MSFRPEGEIVAVLHQNNFSDVTKATVILHNVRDDEYVQEELVWTGKPGMKKQRMISLASVPG